MFLSSISVAAVGGSGIFLGFILVFLVVLAFGLYTRKGSGIDQRPSKRGDKSDIQGDQGEGGSFGGAGTR